MEKNFKIIEEYLENINLSSNYDEEYKIFLDLIKFLDKIPNLDLDNRKIIENRKIKNLLWDIVTMNVKKIRNGKIKEICENEVGIKLIDIYCILNDINDETKAILSSNDELFKMYLKSISGIPVLDSEKEKELFNRYHSGDESAKEILIKSNLKLVVNIAKRYTNRGLDIMDLIQDGNNKLIDTVERFDPNQNCKFATFAYTCISRYLDYSMAHNSKNFKISNHLYADIKRYIVVKKSLEGKLDFQTTKEEFDSKIAEELKWSIEKVHKIENLQFDTYSLNTIVLEGEHDNDKELESIIPSDDIPLNEVYEKKELKENFKKLLLNCGLDDREMFVVLNRINGLSLEKLAKKIHLTRERVRQLEIKAHKKIINSKFIDSFAIYTDNEEEALKCLEEKRKILNRKRHKN